MKKTIKLWIVTLLVACIIPLSSINAAVGSVSISGPSELAPGATGTYTISFSADDTAFFEYSISASLYANPSMFA